MSKAVAFEEWFVKASNRYNEVFGSSGIELDRDAAVHSFDDGLSPEEYINKLIDEAQDGL